MAKTKSRPPPKKPETDWRALIVSALAGIASGVLFWLLDMNTFTYALEVLANANCMVEIN
jgi:hypothetical protein